MIQLTQTKYGTKDSQGKRLSYGNCLATCIAGILNLQPEMVPNIEIFYCAGDSKLDAPMWLDVINIWLKTCYTYFIFLLMIKSKWYFSIPTLILLLIDQSFKFQIDFDKNKDPKNPNIIRYEKFREIIYCIKIRYNKGEFTQAEEAIRISLICLSQLILTSKPIATF
jgi:hypothetical protein